MNAPKDFLQSLAPGDLVAATVQSSAKLHLIRVVRRVTADMCKGQPNEDRLLQMVDGRVLCSARPRYWWTPTDQLEGWKAANKCWHCFAEHRRQGYPAIKGWAKAERPVQSAVRLPWGWQEVTPGSHPLDLPDDASEPDPDESEQKVGSKRKEVARWVRGRRYVRITQSLKDKRFCLRYGAMDDKPTEENWWCVGGWEGVLTKAVTLMALGGSRTGRTEGKLVMKDVAVRG